VQGPVLPMIPTNPVDIAIAIAVIVGSVGVVAIGAMLVRAVIKKWLHPTPIMAPDLSAELQELRQTVGQLSVEVGELNERVDFAERMLAQHSDRARIEGAKE